MSHELPNTVTSYSKPSWRVQGNFDEEFLDVMTWWTTVEKESKVLLVPAMTAYLGSGGITPPILKHGTRWRVVVNFTPRPFIPGGESRYPWNVRLGGPQSRSGRFEVRNVFECCLIEVTEMLAEWRGFYSRRKWDCAPSPRSDSAVHLVFPPKCAMKHRSPKLTWWKLEDNCAPVSSFRC